MVKLIRVLTLICFSLGLFVQVAAQAAVPQNAVAEMVDCAEMAQAIPELSMDADDPSSDREGCCPDMTIDCLVAMNSQLLTGSRKSNQDQNPRLHKTNSLSSISRTARCAVCELEG